MLNQFENLEMEKLIEWDWGDFEPLYTDLNAAALQEGNTPDWLSRWTVVSDLLEEVFNRLYVLTSINTRDENAQQRFDHFIEKTYPKAKAAEEKLRQKFLASGCTLEGFKIPLRNMRADVAVFREENLGLMVEEEKLNTAHDKIIGAQTVEWRGEEKTVRQMEVVLRENERQIRREGWERIANRQLQDRQAINHQWQQYMELRKKIAANADCADYRAYRWKVLKRFDYSPQDCKKFHSAIEKVVVPAVGRMMERRRERLGVDTLKYFDLFVDPTGLPPLHPFADGGELEKKASAIFHQVAPRFGKYFDRMRDEGLLDLVNRKNKADGGYCTYFSHSKQPFIFANAVGIHDDVQTLMHEGGHAFHAFESFDLPYFQQRSESNLPTEIAEVASMTMEFFTHPYFEASKGGFYSSQDAARAVLDHLEGGLSFWPYMAIVDAFQHWSYEHPQSGGDPDQCDQKWMELEKRFRPFIDWRGYEDVLMTGWHRKGHIHYAPFYYVDYGLAMLGAVQIWGNYLNDQSAAVADYCKMLSMGATATLPALYRAAGARFAFGEDVLRDAVSLMEGKMKELDAVL